VSSAAARFESDVSALLGQLPSRDQEALSGLVSRLLVAHAADQGIDLFATDGPEVANSVATMRSS
jgi:hypothetical protein